MESPPPLLPVTQAALVGSAVMGAAFVGVGLYDFVASSLPGLFCFTLVAIGGLGLTLAERARHRRRAPWAYLIAMWGVVAFCGFFTAPQVLSLRKLEQVTVELELKYGHDKAADRVSDDNLEIRGINLGVCALFAAPFAGLCIALSRGRRDYERPAA